MRRLLYIAHRVPYPPDKGERVRAFHEIQALAGAFRITLAYLSHDPSDRQAAGPLGSWCEKVLLAPAGGKLGLVRGAIGLLCGRSVTEGYFHSTRLGRLLAEEARREPFDLVFAYCSSVLPLALSVPAKARVIDLMDVDSAKWAAYAENAAWPKNRLYRMEARAVGELEQQAVERCDAVFLVSDAEARALPDPKGKALGVGNGVDCEYFRPEAVGGDPPVKPPYLVFTGSMDYRPNVEGVCWFAREVWPELRREAPELSFAIVGRNPARAVRDLEAVPGVVVTGSVPDVRPYLRGASAAVVPLRMARGIQNKVLEAMAMAKPVVASQPALEGLDLAVGSHVLQADSPQQWLSGILHMLRDRRASKALGQAARRWVLAEYTWPARLAPLVETCERLTEEHTEAVSGDEPTACLPPAACLAAAKPGGEPSGDRHS